MASLFKQVYVDRKLPKAERMNEALSKLDGYNNITIRTIKLDDGNWLVLEGEKNLAW